MNTTCCGGDEAQVEPALPGNNVVLSRKTTLSAVRLSRLVLSEGAQCLPVEVQVTIATLRFFVL
jgi:hypothetical protein